MSDYDEVFTIFSLFSFVGAFVLTVWLSKTIIKILRVLYHYVLCYLQLNIKWKRLGRWAVVTGGSDGIGKAYAEELAAKGFNVILISRTADKLNATAANISRKYSVQTKTISLDFFDGSHIYEKLKQELEVFEVGVLVNNIGMSYKHPEYFHSLSEDFVEKIIRSNIVSCTMMTRIILPQMVKRHCGVIINISSLTALYPMPLLNIYSASKAYVDYFTRALQFEYKDKGIIVQSVLPGYVATEMSKRRISLEVPSSRTYVQNAIKTVGLEQVTYGYSVHKIRGALHEWLKENMPTWVNMAIALHFMKKSRERYFQKLRLKYPNSSGERKNQ